MAIIVIDPGHYGGYNPGVCYGYYEGNTMLKLAKYLGAILTAMGARIVYTRTTNEENPSLAQRGGMVKNADLFISLHSDASSNASVRGVTSYYSLQRPQSAPFAANIGIAAANAMGNPFRGAQTWASANNPSLDYMGVLRAAVATNVKNAFLIEHGFHTNMDDCEFLSVNFNLETIAAAEAVVIAQYFNLKLNYIIFYTVQSGDSLYKISRKFGVAWQSIATANSISAPYVIKPGQRLIVPVAAQNAPECMFICPD